MDRAALRVAAYRFRATFGRRWGGYLALVLLIGLVGGLAMGAVAGARRTQSSFPVLFAHELSVVPAPSVPVMTVVLIAVGALAFGNVVAGLPARIAARTQTALLLRAE